MAYKKIRKKLSFALLFASFCAALPAYADEELDQLMNMSLDNLFDVKVTLLSRTEESVIDAPAAISVITAEDIRRLGARSIPEALRHIPGLQVARMDSNKWMVTSRGFGGQFSNKLLVLMDGRTIYSHVFGGVMWDEHNMMIENIERIEVIRGPGATMWGSNAVNGVINIITKKAKDTQGSLAIAGIGDGDIRGFLGARHGGGDETHQWRTYIQGNRYDNSLDVNKNDSYDGWSNIQGGFRSDWSNENIKTTLIGDVLYMDQEFRLLSPQYSAPFFRNDDVTNTFFRSFINGNIEKNMENGSTLKVTSYLDYASRDYSIVGVDAFVADVDAQYSFNANEKNKTMVGLGYRYVSDQTKNTEFFTFNKDSANDDLLSAFIQNQTTLVDEQLYLTTGLKYEHTYQNESTFQPSARVQYNATEKDMLWAAVSKANRNPTRALDLNALVYNENTPINLIRWQFVDSYKPEELIAYELGYRTQPMETLLLDATIFLNDYKNLINPSLTSDFFVEFDPVPHAVLPYIFDNNIKGRTHGIELSAQYQANEDWKLKFFYAYMNANFKQMLPHAAFAVKEAENNFPPQQFGFSSYLNLPYDFEFDTSVLFVDRVPFYDIEHYIRLDARLGWKPADGVEFSIMGTNLLDDAHQEFNPSIFTNTSQIPRAVYGMVSVNF